MKPKLKRYSSSIFAAALFLIAIIFLLNDIANDSSSEIESKENISVFSYNIWNVMFHWPVRKRYIAKLIAKESPTLIALQEVREGHNKNGKSQLQELLDELPRNDYPFSQFIVASYQTNTPGEVEGLALASKYRILQVEYVNLTLLQSDEDRNTRACLAALIDIPVLGPTYFVVGHLSYSRAVQCRNIYEILQFLDRLKKSQSDRLKGNKEIPFILAGDWNAYIDWEHPLAMFSGSSQTNECWNYLTPQAKAATQSTLSSQFQFSDVWKVVHPQLTGNESFTFSNMPWPGKQSRPDRILYDSKCLNPIKVELLGTGREYKNQYYLSILWDRRSEVWPLITKSVVITFILFLGIILYSRRYYLVIVHLLIYGIYLSPPLFNYIAEEFFPSDHDAVKAVFRIKC